MADGGDVLAERDGGRQEHRDPERDQADGLHRDARGARQLTPDTRGRVALPPIAEAAFHRRDPAAQIVRFGGPTMGTEWSAQVVAPPAGLGDALAVSLDQSSAALSQWVPDSALSRFNRAPLGEWQALHPVLAEVLATGLAIARLSGGAFDPACGALSELWGFGTAGRRARPPGADAVAAALTRSGAGGIEFDGRRSRRLRDLALDLSGIGKGHAVDRLATVARDHGCDDFLVEIGGEFVGSGIRPDGGPWWVELEDPPLMKLASLRVAAHELAVATSGDYRRYIAAGTKRLGHTLDPRTGRPIINGIVSVTVIADTCMIADAWATALTVLGAERGLATARSERLAARIVTGDGVEHLSAALRAMLDD